MHVRKLCEFLERRNNAVFITEHEEQWRWLEDAKAVMYVNHGGLPIRILGQESQQGKAQGRGVGEPVLWDKLNGRMSEDLRKHLKGFVTLATFDTATNSPEPFRAGQSLPVQAVQGYDNPLMAAVVGGAVLAALVFFISQTMPKKKAASQEQ